MDRANDHDQSSSTSQEDRNDALPLHQINPLTTMTSATAFQPVDDEQENLLESTCMNTSPMSPADIATLPSDRLDRLSTGHGSSMTSANEQSIVAWVQSTTAESLNATIERSPSLPSTLLEPSMSRSRKNSTVSTLCDQQQQQQQQQSSAPSDTMSSSLSQNASTTTDLQRSHSFPRADQHEHYDEEAMQLVNDDFSSKFLPVPESEDSEVDRKSKASPNESLLFNARSPVAEEQKRNSANVSFHASVSFEAHAKPMSYRQRLRRQRHNSWTANKNESPAVQRFHSHKVTAQRALSHSQRLHTPSVSTDPNFRPAMRTDPSSSISDNVFRSISNTNSSSVSQTRPVTTDAFVHPTMASTPSVASVPSSSDRFTSNVSDASGLSGIESSNLRTSASEPPQTASIIEGDTSSQRNELFARAHREASSASTGSSRTASTESLLTSSSEDEMHTFHKKLNALNRAKKLPQTPANQRLDALRQLMWLLEKRPNVHPPFNFLPQKTIKEPAPVNSSSRSTKIPSHVSSNESNPTVTGKPSSGQLYSSANEVSNQVHSLPANFQPHQSPSPGQGPGSPRGSLDHSYSSVRSIHSDSSLNASLINTKPITRSNAVTGTTSLVPAAHLQRKRIFQHRRNLSGLAAGARDRKNSFSKSHPIKSEDQLNASQLSQQQAIPLERDIKAILNEHLTMINNLLLNYSFNASIQYPSQNSSIREFLYRRLNELSLRNPMKQRCSRSETKAFIDSITTYQMNRSHHYRFLIDSVRDLLKSTHDSLRLSTGSNNTDEPSASSQTLDDGIAGLESSMADLIRDKSTNPSSADSKAFEEHPLRFFRTLSPEYIRDCEQTEKDLTQKLFDIADKQHILYCLKHVDSGHTNDLLSIFHRRLDAIFVWYNLYYELTISVKKLSGLLRCDDCEDWPKLHFRSLATDRERKAKRADEKDSDEDSSTSDDGETETTEEVEVEHETELDEQQSGQIDDDNDRDIIPKTCWSDEPLDQFSNLKISDGGPQSILDSTTQKLDRTACYRNFVYYMDKRSYQVKYDGLARTLIERIALVLGKTRLALLQTPDRRQIQIEQVFAGLSLSDLQLPANHENESKTNTANEDIEDKLVDTDNPVNDDSATNLNIGELTIESWLHHVLKSCPTIKIICSHTDDILKQNWLELHEQLGLPSLLPLYYFIINVLLDVMHECLTLYNKPYMNNDRIEIDALCRQQLVREAKLVLRDALATRLYTVRMMEQFMSNRQIASELAEFDEKTVTLYMHYKQFLSTVSINRMYDVHDDRAKQATTRNNNNNEYYYYVDEETSELIKEYYFARDLTLTLGNRDLIHELGIQFNDLVRGILAQLKEELYETTESYYQAFAADTSNASSTSDGIYSADVVSDSSKTPYFHSSISVPPDFALTEMSLCDAAASFSEQKKCEIIYSTREFRRSFDTIKQRTIRICSLAKKLIDDFSIAAEFKCVNYADLWHQLRQSNYVQVKIRSHTSNSDDFDSFYSFVPPWLSNDRNQVEQLLSIICSQQLSNDELKKTTRDIQQPSFIIFIPRKTLSLPNKTWPGDTVLIRASASTQLALNSTELTSLHMVVTRSDHWQSAVDLFCNHFGAKNNVQLIKRSARDEDIRLTFDQLPDNIDKLSNQLTHLVRMLNAIWDQDSIKIFLTEIVKFDERQLRTIESKLLDLVLYVYNSGFELFRLLYELLPSLSKNDEKNLRRFVSNMNEFFCEWCKCVTKKFKYTSTQQARAVKFKVLRPRWFSPGMIFLGFLAKSPHLQLLTEDEYKKLMTEMPMALQALRGNTFKQDDPSALKDAGFLTDQFGRSNSFARSNSVSSTITNPARPRNRSSGHRRDDSSGGGGALDLLSLQFLSTPERIEQSIKRRENELEQKLRERKQIGHIYNNNSTTATVPGTALDPVSLLKTRTISFPWRRGTRIGQGGAGIAFRAINCADGSIVCMKEIQLSSIASRSLPSTYPDKLRRIAEEIDMIMSINHPNIVRYFGIEKYKRTIYICMEYCLSTVNEFLNDIRAFQKRAHTRKSISGLWTDSSDQDDETTHQDVHLAPSLNVNELVRGFVKQLLQALLALHEHYIIHCDVKGDNIFIANENGHYIVKLGDFNLSHRLELESPSVDRSDSRSTQFGTLYFKPPEPEYVYQSDIWALGCTVMEMLTGKLPWTNVTRPHEERIYIQNQLLAKKGPPIPDELKEQKEAYEFIQLCLTPDVDERPLAKALLGHPYPRVRTDS